MGGVPCLRGLRIPVATVIGMLGDGMTEAEILSAYPDLERADISALPRRERQLWEMYDRQSKVFRSALPRRERLWSLATGHRLRRFDPRSREGSDAAQAGSALSRKKFR